MKRIFMTGLLAAVMIAAAADAARAELKVGVVDLDRVSQDYQRYQAATKTLEKRKEQLQRIVDEEEQSVLGLIEDLESIRASAKAEDIRKRRDEIEKRDRDLREFVGGTNLQFRDDLDSLQWRTRLEVETVVITVARNLGLDIVLDQNTLLFSSASLDITEKVVAELNKRFLPIKGDFSESAAAATSSGAASPGKAGAAPTAFPAAEPPEKGRWPFR